MAFYAAPSYISNVVSLRLSGYVPPLANVTSKILSNSGIYTYAAPKYDGSVVSLSSGYTPPAIISVVLKKNKGFAGSQNLLVIGFNAGEIGDLIASPTQYVEGEGFDASLVSEGANAYLATREVAVERVPRLSATLSYSAGYELLSHKITTLRLFGDQVVFGQHLIGHKVSEIYPYSFTYSTVSERLNLRNNTTVVEAEGFESFDYSNGALVENFDTSVFLHGIEPLEIAQPLIYNFIQYVLLDSIDSSEYGEPYLQGGVKYIEPDGFDSVEFGLASNGERYLEPAGFDSSETGGPNVSPRILYADGIYDRAFGVPDIRTPILLPEGFNHTGYGDTTIWFHTRLLSPTGLLAYQSGYPVAADPTQFIQTPSLTASAIFGDTATRNLSALITVVSIDDGSFSDYATLTNSNRYYKPAGISSLSVGSTIIRNGTPQIFIEGIEPNTINNPAVGYRIREVLPTGFDKLGLGNHELTKSPELSPQGIDSNEHGLTTVWHKVRTINADGFDSFDAGEPTTWFRYRYLAPESWASSEFSVADITHGLREIISNGFASDEYGDLWISQGARQLEPKSIYDENLSSHLVGGTRFIEPQGYIATLFGERIIPISQEIGVQGFTGVWGLTSVALHTQYVLPAGYISVGTAPADRWGSALFYNQTQIITQEFDINNGLVPPKWSEWTLIENRDKQLNVTGLASQKFGYSQIDNNAAPLLPAGITPPPITVGMVSHDKRQIALDGIEPPIVSSWGVVYNDARVIYPVGSEQSLIGSQASIANNRRYYNNVGRLDSLEAGTPMIAYRIRTIDIEPRYSIAPPQIELPTVDIWTRYVELRGYESDRYGLPSLSIHFNIIAPKWVYKEKQGTPALHNVTPTLYGYGHNSDEYGTASIRTQWRNVNALGDTATLFGLTGISDTKQNILPNGWQDTMVSQLPIVIQMGTNPYVTQTIRLNEREGSIGEFNHGFDVLVFGEIGLNQNVLYAQGDEHTEFGGLTINSNTIEPIGYGIENVPNGVSVSNKNRLITFDGKDIIESQSAFGKPRLSPHTIWATADAPKQAIENHSESGIFSPLGGLYGSSVFGNAHLESTIRSVTPTLFDERVDTKGFGNALLTLKLRIIAPEPFRFSRFGLPSIPFTVRTITMREGFNDESFGQCDIAHYEAKNTISPDGFVALQSGDASIDNNKRHLYADGFDELLMGISKGGDTPYMWQTLRVGEYVPLIIGGTDTSVFGETVVSLRVREVAIQGFDAFRSVYSIESFRERMIVKNASNGRPPTRQLGVLGFTSNNKSIADVRLGQHFIRPDGNSNQFRKGGYHA